MRIVVNKREVAHLWAHKAQHHAKTSTGNFYFHDSTIFSYGYHFPIATFINNNNGDEAVLVTTRTYSVTTASHISMVKRAITHLDNVFHVPLTSGDYHNTDVDLLKMYVNSYRERISAQQTTVVRARAERNRNWAFDSLVKLVNEANNFCRFFGLTDTFEVASDFDSLKATLQQTANEKRKETIKRNREIAKINADKVKRWIAGENVQLPYHLDKVYLRIEGEEVVTSKGARFPVSHATKGLMFVQAVVASGKEYQRNGHTIRLGHYVIDKVDVNGNVVAGCHKVGYDEIQRIAPMLAEKAEVIA